MFRNPLQRSYLTLRHRFRRTYKISFLNLLLKPMYKEFNAFNKFEESKICFTLERAKQIPLQEHEEIHQTKDLRVLFKDMISLLEAAEEFKKEMNSEGTISMEGDFDDDELDKQPLSKRFKIMTPIHNPIPLNTFIPGHLLKPKEQQKSLHEFTD
ncbi:hypothetical protein Tco_0371897 [Tanacetum coccineum]